MTRAEKIEKLNNMSGNELANAYKWYSNNFNPIDEERCDTFELIKTEIMKHLNGYNN